MSLPSYILNWEELIGYLKDKINVIIDGELNFDFSNLEDILNKYFPDIIELLKALVDNTKKPSGVQKMKGYHKQVISNHAYEFIFMPSEDVLLTGITYAQSIYKCDDTFDLILLSDEGKGLTLFESLYVKDALQHKLFQLFCPIPEGYTIKLIMNNGSGITKDVWVDFEYIGVQGLVSMQGTVLIRYLAYGPQDYILLLEETRVLDFGVHTIINNRDFRFYKKLEPTEKLITLTSKDPTRIVEFFYEKKPDLPIDHPYDIKVTLRWENNSPVDIDMHGFVDKNINKKVWYSSKEYFETEEDKLWLDHDFTSHDENGYEVQPEILTVLGFKSSILSIQLQNYNARELTQDISVEVSKADDTVLATYTIPKNLLNQESTRNIYVCDIDLNKKKVTENIKAIGTVGEF